jgi:hypothetical protein
MGGFGSGRTRRRPVAESSLAFPIGCCREYLRRLYRAHQGHQSGTHGSERRIDGGCMVWTRAGVQVGSCAVAFVQADAAIEMRLSYTNSHATPSGDRVQQPIKDTIPIVTTPCYFGGVRFWFMCHCGERVGVLYAPGAFWQCRHCYRISYQSSNDTDPRVRRLLGGYGGISSPSVQSFEDARHAARVMQVSGADLFVLLKAYWLIEARHARNLRHAEHYARSQVWKTRHRATPGRAVDSG